MTLFKKIGELIGWIVASAFFVVCVVFTAPIVIVKVAVKNFNKTFENLSKLYKGDK